MKSELEKYVIEKLEELRREQGITYYGLARKTGLSYSSVTNMMKRGTTPTIYTIEKLCAGLGITVSQLFGRREIMDNFTKGQQEILELFNEANEEQRELIMTFSRGLLHKLPEK